MEININGVKTNYEIYLPAGQAGGQGQPFLLLHGWGSNSTRWESVAKIISDKGYKVIVPDLPGFGKSSELQEPWDANKYIDWLEKFIIEIKIKDYLLLGHSFGGALASKIAIKKPQEVKKLFLVAAAVIREKTAKKGFLAKLAKAIKIFQFLPYFSFFRKAVYKFIIRKSDYSYVEGIMKQTYLNIIKEDLSFKIPFIKVPTIIIWGDKDELTPIKDARIINEKVKNSKLFVIPDANHNLDRHEHPEKITEIILENV